MTAEVELLERLVDVAAGVLALLRVAVPLLLMGGGWSVMGELFRKGSVLEG